MKNLDLFRRFIIGSMVLALTIPLVYHVALNVTRYNHFNKLTEQICKAIEPRIQIGAHREALEYMKSTIATHGLGAEPSIEFKDHGNFVTPPIQNIESKFRESCEFQGITGVEASVFYNHGPLLNILYLYLYLASVPFLFFALLWARRGVLRLQRKVADTIEVQMKQLLGINSIPEKPKTSLFYKFFDLQIPLLKYLKSHIETLERELKKYSLKIADQQKREVLMEVAAQLAHEIVTPISNLQMILKSDDAKKHEHLILLELSQIKNLSEKLLREYRGEVTILEEKKEIINVVESIHSALESAKLFAKNVRPVIFHFDCKVGDEIKLVGCRSEFIAAISNILRNSVESLKKDNGFIIVKVDQDIENLEISITDNGCGINEENLPKIFENKFSTGKKNGTGLGLYQVKSAIESMAGNIVVESELNHGTTLRLTWTLSNSFSPLLPLDLSQQNIPSQKPDLVLIDDMKSTHVMWDIEARRAQKILISFKSFDEFNSSKKYLDKKTPIFVDYNFENGPLTGKQIAEQIALLGFVNVHIATGFPADHVEKIIGIKSIRCKDFPLEELL